MDASNVADTERTLAVRVEQQAVLERHNREVSSANVLTSQAQKMSMGCMEKLEKTYGELFSVKTELENCKRKLEAFENAAKRAKPTSLCEKDLFPEGSDVSYKVEQLKHLVAADCPSCALTQKGFRAILEFLETPQSAIDTKSRLAKSNYERLQVAKQSIEVWLAARQ